MAILHTPLDVNGRLRHSAAVAQLEDFGVPAPPAYVALRNRLADYRSLNTNMTDRLVSAVLDGSDSDIPALRAAAASEHAGSTSSGTLVASGAAVYGVDQEVLAAGNARLRELYDEVAVPNYQKVAKQFDAVAAKFTKAARTVDPRSTADQVIELAPAVQQAWRDGRELAVELERVSIILRTALLLTGIPHPAQGIPTSSEAYRAAEQSFRIGLCCDTAGLHRRRVWEADAEGWAALVAAGVTLRAQPVDTFEPYRVPQQMMERRHADGTVELVDPHDGDLPPRPEDDTVGAWHPATAPGAIADPLEVHTHR